MISATNILITVIGHLTIASANPVDELPFIEYESGVNLMDTPSHKIWNMPDEDGLYHVGDILYDEARFKQIYGNKTERLMNRNAIADPKYRWPNGELPFIFTDQVSESAREEIRHYISRFNKDMAGCVNIKELTDTTGLKDYVRLIGGPGGNCYSMLGKIGGAQSLSLGERNEKCAVSCIVEHVIVHEFLHSFGLGHVQMRPDRDQYIEVQSDNISSKRDYAIIEDALTFDVPYDGRSTMHYSWKDFAIDEMRPTMLSKMKDVPTTQLGSTRWLSNSDIKMLYRMYDCDISKMPTMTIPDPCHDQSSYKFCSTIAKKGYCVVNEKDCYKTCNCDLNMCVDKFDECRELAENTESCQSEKMQKDCYKSCFPEICSNSFFTTTTAAPPPSVCQDHPEERYSCFEHSRDGKCGQEGFEWMEYDCRASCGLCATTTSTTSTSVSTTTTTANTPPPCTDDNEDCDYMLWYCYSDWAKRFCKKSCNHCDVCIDVYPEDCIEHAKDGECQKDTWGNNYMVKNCRKTCGFCH